MAQDGSVQISTRLDSSNIRNDVQQVNRQLGNIGSNMRQVSDNMITQTDYAARQMERSMSRYNRYMTEAQRGMAMEMRNYYSEQSEAMRQFAGRQVEVQYGFHQISQSARDFQGTNAQFLDQLREQGNLQRKLNDEMMAANKIIVADIHRQAGAMLARSTVASKITAQYERMGNPIYNVNRGFLQMADSLQRVAMAGDPAVTAVRMLGPTANGKQLNDMIRQINTQLMGLPIIAMAAAAATTMLFKTLHDAAYGASEQYAQAWDTMVATVVEALKPMVQAFTMLAVPIFKVVTAMAELVVKFNEAHPVLAVVLQGILMLVPALVLILSPLALGIGLVNGFMVAWNSVWMILGPVVTGLGAMMGTVLLVAAAIMALTVGLYALWQNSETFRNGVYASIEAIKTFGQAIVDFSKYIWSVIAVGDPMNDWLGHLPKGFQDAALKIGEGVNKIREFLSALGQYFFWVVADGDTMNDWLSHLPKSFQGVAYAMGEGVVKIKEALKSLVDAIKAAFQGDFTQLTQVFATLIPTIIGVLVGGFPALLIFFSRFMPDIAAQLQANSSVIIEVFNSVINGIVQFITTQLPIFIQTGVDILTNIIQGLIAAIPLIAEALTQVVTTMVEIITTMLPILIDVGMQLLQTLIDGIITLLPALLDVALQLIMTLVDGMLSLLPTLIETAAELIITIAETIMENLPKILEMGIKILMKLIDGIVQILPKLVETVVNLIVKFVQTVIQNLPKVIEAGIKVLTSLIEGIMKILPKLLETAIKLIVEIVKAIVQNLPKIIEAGKQILQALIKGIIQLVSQLYTTVKKDVLGKISKAVSEFVKDAVQLGKDIIGGLIRGITSMGSEAITAIKGVASDALTAAKKFLGVKSPSRVFAAEVGHWIPPGIAMGIEDNSAVLDKQIRATVDGSVDTANVGVRSGGYGGTTNNYTASQPIYIDLIYQGDGNPEDAVNIADEIEREFGRRQFRVAFNNGVTL